jgi:hypothetical protein
MGTGGKALQSSSSSSSAPAAPNKSDAVLDKLRKLSIREEADSSERTRAQPRPMSSQYDLNYRPLAVGLRKMLWEEGYLWRNQRRMIGFQHEKIEWRLPTTDRSAIG